MEIGFKLLTTIWGKINDILTGISSSCQSIYRCQIRIIFKYRRVRVVQFHSNQITFNTLIILGI